MSKLWQGRKLFRKGVSEAIASGDAARNERNWVLAEQSYRDALASDDSLSHIWVQFGHSLKEQGKLGEAERAYRKGTELAPDVSDCFLQLGHLLKLKDRMSEALDAYKEALRLKPMDADIIREVKHCQQFVGHHLGNASAAFHVYFDISDLVYYIGHHDSLSGIQRVQAATILSLLDHDLSDVGVHFLTYVSSKKKFFEIDQAFMLSLLFNLPLPVSQRTIDFDRLSARTGILPNAKPLEPSTAKDKVLCLLGAGWVINDYALRVRNLKLRHGFRFVLLMHDMIPVYARETCDQGTAEVFTKFLNSIHQVVDAYLCVSENTKRDLIRYYKAKGLSLPGATVTQEGSGFPRVMAQADTSQLTDTPLKTWGLEPQKFILFVSTIEGRKNHLIAFRALQQLYRTRDDIPPLVCVGRLGWRSEEFLSACEASAFLDGKLKILTDISDSELAHLYRSCLFTIYPSAYEGWGLPVGESLDFGKVCITSNTSSLPEVGGEFCAYVEPNDVDALATAVLHFLDQPDALKDLERRIREEYKSIEWKEVSAKILSACKAAAREPALFPAPLIELRREYPVSLAPVLESGLMGEGMAHHIWSVQQRFLLDGVYDRSDYEKGCNARVGEGWCEPEHGHTWARMTGNELAFRLDQPCLDPLVLYISYVLPSPCVGARLVAQVSAGRNVSVSLLATYGTLVIRDIRPIVDEMQYRIAFSIAGPDDLEKLLENIDARCPAFGLRSFIAFRENDIGRLAVAEKVLLAGPPRLNLVGERVGPGNLHRTISGVSV